MNVSIRPYVPFDYQACRALWVELTERHREIYDDATIGGDDPGTEFDTHLAKVTLLATWVAVKDGDAIGFCSLLSEGRNGEIDPIVVRSAERSRGVGRELLGVAIEDAKRRGIRHLSIRPVVRNVEAIQLYNDVGFRTLGHLDMFMDLSDTPGKWKPGVSIHGRDFEY